MRNQSFVSLALIGSLALAPILGCQNLPGKSKEQGAVLGGIGGALAGAVLSKNERGLGALIGGALGAGGGYLIGANKDKFDQKKRDEAIEAHRRAERNPARPEDVERAESADLNDDGFVTLDEVVAMERANLSDREVLDRLERTGQVFELTDDLEQYLEDRGVSREVVLEMRQLGQPEDYARTASAREDASSRRQREALREPREDHERVREHDRPRDFVEVREEIRESERQDGDRAEREQF